MADPENSENPVQETKTTSVSDHAEGQRVRWSLTGLLPAAKELADYEAVNPGFAERLFKMGELSLQSQIELEQRAVTYQYRERLTIRFMSIFFALAALYLSRDLALNGQPWVASIIAGTTVIGVVAALVTGRAPRGNLASHDRADVQKETD